MTARNSNNRFFRRKTLLEGKRKGAFDADQYYYEHAQRARSARKVRSLIRRNVPVVLVTPRWSGSRRFLDDVAIDLSLGAPRVLARPLDLELLKGRTVHESWTWLVRAIIEFCAIYDQGPVWQAVDRHGFRHVMADLFRRAEVGPRRCLLIHGVQHLHVEARDDLISVFESHIEYSNGHRQLNLLLAGSVDAPQFEVQGSERLTLPDFDRAEAVEALVEYVGPQTKLLLEAAIRVVGGVPDFIEAIGEEWRVTQVAEDRSAVWKALGALADEVRGVMQIVSSDSTLSARLEHIARRGTVRGQRDADRQLVRAGLISELGASKGVHVRAPVLADLALGR